MFHLILLHDICYSSRNIYFSIKVQIRFSVSEAYPVVAVLPPEINIASEYINIISRTTESNIDSNKCGWQPVSLSAVG